MGNWLKQSTAACIMLGPLVDNTDGFSPETALTFNATDIRLSKNGATFSAKNEATAPSPNEFGWWKVILNTTDTNTVGELVISASVTGGLPVWREYMVVSSSTYDSIITGASLLNVDVVEWNRAAIATPDVAGYPKVQLAASAIAASNIAASAINNGNFALTAASQIWSIEERRLSSAGLDDIGSEVWGWSPRSLTDKTGYGLSASAVDEIWNESNTGHTTASTYGWFLDKQVSSISGGSSGTTAADIWSYSNRSLSASSIAASTFAASAINKNSFGSEAASTIWNHGNRILTGATNIDDGVWAYGSRSLTDKAEFILAASSIGPSTIAASSITENIFTDKAGSAIWNSAVRVITGGSVVATSGSVVVTSNLDKTNYWLAASAIAASTFSPSAITAGVISLSGGSQIWNVAARSLTDKSNFILAASSIAASTLAASAITENIITDRSASSHWNVAVRTITGGTITSNGDKTGYGLSGSALGEISASVSTASGVWTYSTRALTDKTNFGLSASAVDDVWNEVQSGHTTASTFGLYLDRPVSSISGGSSGTTAFDIWNYATRTITGGSISVNNDKLDYGLSGSSLSEIAASSGGSMSGGLSASDIWAYETRTITGGSVTSINDKTNYILAASSIGSSTLAASSITDGIFTATAASQVWRSAVRNITSGSITVNNDKTGYGLTASAITNTTITDAARNAQTQNTLMYDISTINGEASRSILNAIRFLRNRWNVAGSTLYVYKEDDVTTAWTSGVYSASSASPITGIDPA